MMLHPAVAHLIAGAGVPLMAAGGGAGAVTVWNLEERRLHTIIRDAHDAPVTQLHFFPGWGAALRLAWQVSVVAIS